MRVLPGRGGRHQRARRATTSSARSRATSSRHTLIGVSTDKACKPINVMGMTKALQERIVVEGNLPLDRGSRMGCVRYGNVLSSRGSVIPLFRHQIASGGPVTITLPEMTRFLISLDRGGGHDIRRLPRGAGRARSRPARAPRRASPTSPRR